jgi:cytochrome c
MQRAFVLKSLALAGAAAFALSVAACSPGGAPKTAEKAPEAPKVEAPAPPAPAAEAKMVETQIKGADGKALMGDVTAGQKIFQQCAACHALQAGVNRVGPSLHGIIGRKAGSVAGFRYSDANKASGKTWTEDALFTYLENPRASIPGTTMAFAGLKKSEDRVNVIAYIQENSK